MTQPFGVGHNPNERPPMLAVAQWDTYGLAFHATPTPTARRACSPPTLPLLPCPRRHTLHCAALYGPTGVVKLKVRPPSPLQATPLGGQRVEGGTGPCTIPISAVPPHRANRLPTGSGGVRQPHKTTAGQEQWCDPCAHAYSCGAHVHTVGGQWGQAAASTDPGGCMFLFSNLRF